MIIFYERCLRFIASLPVVMLYYLYGKGLSEFVSSSFLSNTVVSIAKYSFGIYLLQEIVIRLFYYFSPLPTVLTDVGLPMVTFILTFAISYATIYVMSKSKATKWLLG